MSWDNPKNRHRRNFLKTLGLGLGALPALELVPLLLNRKVARAQSVQPIRILKIFCGGAWDTLLAGDPPNATKLASGNFDANYGILGTTQVPGKSNLIVGSGLEAAATNAFTKLPTAFINGMKMDVTAHAPAETSMKGCKFSLSVGRYPDILARLSKYESTFPNVTLHGDGKFSVAGIAEQVSSLNFGSALTNLFLDLPDANANVNDNVLPLAYDLAKRLDEIRKGKLPEDAAATANAWTDNTNRIPAFYAKNFQQAMTLTPQIRTRYGIPGPSAANIDIAQSFLALKAGMTRFVSCNLRNFDTHSQHFPTHLPLLQNLASLLNVLVDDLMTTPDPDVSGKMLSDTTLIWICSEFVRTPLLNLNQGTDHWQSASSILMGAGVTDNKVIGATGIDARPLGWNFSANNGQGASEPLNENNALLPEHLGFEILKLFSQTAEGLDLGVMEGMPGLFEE